MPGADSAGGAGKLACAGVCVSGGDSGCAGASDAPSSFDVCLTGRPDGGSAGGSDRSRDGSDGSEAGSDESDGFDGGSASKDGGAEEDGDGTDDAAGISVSVFSEGC